MSFFQNPFAEEFRGSIPFGDRQYSITFSVPGNKSHGQPIIAWNVEPYNFSTYNSFTINFAIDKDFKNFAAVTVNVAGATPSATTADEVVTLLNADAQFSSWFTASTMESTKGTRTYRVAIKSKSDLVKLYVTNSGAEQIFRFNKYAGVAELPSYYLKHTIANRFSFKDSVGVLVHLDESDATVDQPIITDAGLDYTAMKADWQLLSGRVGLFTFKKVTVDGSDRITEIIEYPAGAVAGDIGKKTTYAYTSSNKNANKVIEIPWTLGSGDLVTP